MELNDTSNKCLSYPTAISSDTVSHHLGLGQLPSVRTEPCSTTFQSTEQGPELTGKSEIRTVLGVLPLSHSALHHP